MNRELKEIELRTHRVKVAQLEQRQRKETYLELYTRLVKLPPDVLQTLFVTSMPFGGITDGSGKFYGFCAHSFNSYMVVCLAKKGSMDYPIPWGQPVPTFSSNKYFEELKLT